MPLDQKKILIKQLIFVEKFDHCAPKDLWAERTTKPGRITTTKDMMIIKFFCWTTLLALGAAQSPSNVTFIHINDHHSHFEELSFDIRDAAFLPTAELNITTSNIRMYYGGFSRAVALFKLFATQAQEAGNDVVKVHAGDAITGTAFYTFFKNEMDATGMNLIGFDAFVLGNHEFE